MQYLNQDSFVLFVFEHTILALRRQGMKYEAIAELAGVSKQAVAERVRLRAVKRKAPVFQAGDISERARFI